MTTAIESTTPSIHAWTQAAITRYATETSEWKADSAGVLCRWHSGELHGAKLRQSERVTPEFGVTMGRIRVIERGPTCPSWCESHSISEPEFEGDDPQAIFHERVVYTGVGRVVIQQLENAATGEMSRAEIQPPDLTDAITAAQARSLATALEQAAELIEQA